MSLALRTSLGCTEAVLADNATLHLFYNIADMLGNDLRIKFLNKEDEFDSINWDFKYKGNTLTLHYSIYNGISLFPTAIRKANSKENAAVVKLATLLEGKLLNRELQRNIA